jgi:hypothetical protein
MPKRTQKRKPSQISKAALAGIVEKIAQIVWTGDDMGDDTERVSAISDLLHEAGVDVDIAEPDEEDELDERWDEEKQEWVPK